MFNFAKLFSPSNDQIAALDLGSNSFHLIIANWNNGQIQLLDRIKESVRMGWGLQPDGSLDEASYNRAMECLSRFGERLRGFQPGSVRVVGTKTLRSINTTNEFLREAELRLGHPVEVVSGEEEARLIYLGVAHNLAPNEQRKRILMDIGGGSTEVIIGQGMNLLQKESLSMGCVAITRRFFSDGLVTERQLKKARIACLQELKPVQDDMLETGWQETMGASGTIKAVASVCRAQGWSNGEITAELLSRIQQLYLDKGSVEVKIEGLSEDREPVFLGGVMVLSALFEALQLAEMTAAEWALREGLLYDLKGRLVHNDIRDASVDNLASRYGVNKVKADKVQKTALGFLSQVESAWDLEGESSGKLLAWASQLYLVGLGITHSDYHKHGAYIVQHVDLAGFSRQEQRLLSSLVLAHRKRFPVRKFPMENHSLIRLAILLRLAAIIHRGRKIAALPEFHLVANGAKLQLQIPQKWLNNNPLTQADLENEIRYEDEAGYQLEIALA